MALMILVSACGKEKMNNFVEPTVEEVVEGLGEEDGLTLIKEKLPEGYEATFYDEISDENENDFYLYQVENEEAILDQKLAVNCESGEVMVYEEHGEEFLPYDKFILYDKTKDENVSWNGEYTSDKYTIVIEETDPGNFEYRILQGEEEKYLGFAFFNDYTNASSETKEYGVVTLILTDNGLKIETSVESDISGIYDKEGKTAS